MTSWVRLWHDMPNDPKWRVIARKSGQSISEVIAVFNFMMVNASANANERGRTHNLFADDIAAALDLQDVQVQAIFDAMKGKVWDGEILSGWDSRQPKREDNSASRAKEWRDAKKAERKRTQTNATERPDTDADIPIPKGIGLSPDSQESSDAKFWREAKAYLGGNNPGALIGKWSRDYGKSETAGAITASQIERAVDPVSYIERCLRGKGGNGKLQESLC